MKNKKVIVLMKDELDGKIMAEFAALRLKTYSYLTDDNDENKKAKDTKKCLIKRKIKFKDRIHCLEADQLENKINQLEKYKVDGDSLRNIIKKFIKNNKLILKTQQRFRSEKLNAFNEEVNYIDC